MLVVPVGLCLLYLAAIYNVVLAREPVCNVYSKNTSHLSYLGSDPLLPSFSLPGEQYLSIYVPRCLTEALAIGSAKRYAD